MDHSERISKLLDEAGITIGDTIRVVSKGREYEGILMPHHEFSSEDILSVKIASGYNIGIEIDESCSLELLEKGVVTRKVGPGIIPTTDKPRVTIIGTGGTIASYVDYRTGAVHPAMSAEDLVYSVPELSEMADIHASLLFSIFSEDMTADHWRTLAQEVAGRLDSGADGVIIPHGTDTMGYTAAALSFMLGELPGPVILVGAQRSSDRPSSDSAVNLLSAVELATSSDLGEVVVLMHSGTSDRRVSIHRGTIVRKMHTSARDAFVSINGEPLGHIENGTVTMSQPYRKKGHGPMKLRADLEKNVALVYSYPGISPDQITDIAQRNKGIVIVGTGLGHVPDGLVERIRKVVSDGVFVVMTSQCLYGRVNMNVYSRGRDLLKAGVISGEDMLPETALVKLMWVLGQTSDPGEVRNLVEGDIRGEISNQRKLSHN